ncbi:hypothetical protein JG687_00009695 [Phytophthora cactorum]|uniref:Uncharacterized protein n=2 Tax=Phytophthora TaxID=4783 RepID=A0A8J5IQ49_9STRA|nr:hypothetical protein JG688_00012351 [Phytophthora aleatoria]KAG6957930.1 hypothetical protein JG687_00009695 [Phytophthora cactorum]
MSWPEGGKRLPLWDAIYSGDIVAAQTLLVTKTGAAQVNAPHGNLMVVVVINIFTQINGTTPLHLAVEINRRDIVQDLLLAGADPLLRNVQ